MSVKLVPASVRCHFRLAHQQGRGGNRRAIYVCQSHPGGTCQLLGFRGWTNKKALK